jgi:hypothetical protein
MKKTVQSDMSVQSVPVITNSVRKVKLDLHDEFIASLLLIPIIIILIVSALQIPYKQAASVTAEPIPTVAVVIPTVAPIKTIGGGFKAIESVSNITRKSSAQWKLAQLYWIDSDGFCRFNDYYVVAMGTKYAQRIGQTFEIQFTGRTIFAILGDSKRDTDVVDGVCKENGSIVEFVVDTMDGDRLQQLMSGEVISIKEIGVDLK